MEPSKAQQSRVRLLEPLINRLSKLIPLATISESRIAKRVAITKVLSCCDGLMRALEKHHDAHDERDDPVLSNISQWLKTVLTKQGEDELDGLLRAIYYLSVSD
jgi:hypothetical protein